ncbi:hypothetical protein [Flavobacterium sp. J27]|uniref:hypothetical protein n=1 Tax=Flavobacterium sp. J27 TaxID=2060419 RepID=UPI001030D3F2|nr:hypothetical protein [Flavobacterium sp. J27]
MSLKNNKPISTYKELNFIVSEAIDKLERGLLTDQEYEAIILNVEKEMKKIKSIKKDNALRDFFWKIIN